MPVFEPANYENNLKTCTLWRPLTVFGVLIMYLIAFVPNVVEAHGGGTEIYRASSGPYIMVVSVHPEQPKVGAIHLTITPLKQSNSEPILDAEVGIVAYSPDGDRSLRVRALNTPIERRYYDANLTVMAAGTWRVIIDVNSDLLGRMTFNVPFDVAEQSIYPNFAGTFVWLVIIAAIAGGGMYLWYSSSRKRVDEAQVPFNVF